MNAVNLSTPEFATFSRDKFHIFGLNVGKGGSQPNGAVGGGVSMPSFLSQDFGGSGGAQVRFSILHKFSNVKFKLHLQHIGAALEEWLHSRLCCLWSGRWGLVVRILVVD
jgi:hypothetical protein